MAALDDVAAAAQALAGELAPPISGCPPGALADTLEASVRRNFEKKCKRDFVSHPAFELRVVDGVLRCVPA